MARTIAQRITTEPANFSLGVVAWPHDRPATGRLTYRNVGPTDLTISLTIDAGDPNGLSVPAGLFSLSTNQIVVPAGGSANLEARPPASLDDVPGMMRNERPSPGPQPCTSAW